MQGVVYMPLLNLPLIAPILLHQQMVLPLQVLHWCYAEGTVYWVGTCSDHSAPRYQRYPTGGGVFEWRRGGGGQCDWQGGSGGGGDEQLGSSRMVSIMTTSPQFWLLVSRCSTSIVFSSLSLLLSPRSCLLILTLPPFSSTTCPLPLFPLQSRLFALPWGFSTTTGTAHSLPTLSQVYAWHSSPCDWRYWPASLWDREWEHREKSWEQVYWRGRGNFLCCFIDTLSHTAYYCLYCVGYSYDNCY